MTLNKSRLQVVSNQYYKILLEEKKRREDNMQRIGIRTGLMRPKITLVSGNAGDQKSSSQMFCFLINLIEFLNKVYT